MLPKLVLSTLLLPKETPATPYFTGLGLIIAAAVDLRLHILAYKDRTGLSSTTLNLRCQDKWLRSRAGPNEVSRF
eukprot:6265274-Amphidinium_carterae.1